LNPQLGFFDVQQVGIAGRNEFSTSQAESLPNYGLTAARRDDSLRRAEP